MYNSVIAATAVMDHVHWQVVAALLVLVGAPLALVGMALTYRAGRVQARYRHEEAAERTQWERSSLDEVRNRVARLESHPRD